MGQCKCRCSQAKGRNKRVFNYCQTSVLSFSTVGSLVDHRAYKPYTLVGPPVRRPVLAPLAFYSSTTDYMCCVFASYSFVINWLLTLNLVNQIKFLWNTESNLCSKAYKETKNVSISIWKDICISPKYVSGSVSKKYLHIRASYVERLWPWRTLELKDVTWHGLISR